MLDDISQIILYSEAKGSNEAILIYPEVLKNPVNETIGDNHVRTLTFSLESDLEKAGKKFIQNLLN